jgi:hypothetical protein
MSEQNKTQDANVVRRDLLRKSAKAAYMIPAILAAVKATERPAYASTSAPAPPPTPIIT